MKIRNILLTTGLVLAFAVPASAQNKDAAYCRELGDTYQYYAGANTDRHTTFGRDAAVDVAIEKCKTGDLSGISVLEQDLKDARIDLPMHD
jgi:hypothetical protein